MPDCNQSPRNMYQCQVRLNTIIILIVMIRGKIGYEILTKMNKKYITFHQIKFKSVNNYYQVASHVTS